MIETRSARPGAPRRASHSNRRDTVCLPAEVSPFVTGRAIVLVSYVRCGPETSFADLAAVPVKKVKRDGKAIVSDTRPERTANLAKA